METLKRLLEEAHDGRIQVPEFQRELILKHEWMKGLLASVSLGYPIGAGTLLEAGIREMRFEPPGSESCKSTLIRADLASCPADARCHDVQLPDCPAGGKCPVASMGVRVATRRLTCPLVYGDIHPTAACAALEDLMRLRKGRHLGLCSCAPMLTGFPQARAVGRYKGHRVSIPLDVCSLCGVGRFGRAAYRDAAILMPQP
jgi:hypothetical protein